MSLTPGTRVGPYEITALIGEGGMGKVWRAHHTALNRDDALKVLPDAFASDPDRLARFRREAQVLASLNHPNIAHVYGLEQADGIQALVMELVEGRTLGDRIAEGPIPNDDALPIARQIAEALEAAHEQGIIHRDLKPANIKVRPDGTVKVLDFGLAKAMEPAGAMAANNSISPTITSPAMMTGVGMILGTAAYMSPEQARGKPVDKRADIWAFGCVLYEMLAGHTLFARPTTSDTIAAVLEHEPDWNALPATMPLSVRRLLARCLDKDLRRRLQHIGDARIEIEDVLSGAAGAPADRAEAGARQRRTARLSWSVAMVASVVALIAVAALMWVVRSTLRAPPLRISRMTIASSGATAVAPGINRSLAITPDGSRVVYVGNGGRQIFVRPLDELEATAIVTGAAPLNFVFVAPDGQNVGFEEGATIKKVAITGGPITTFAKSIAHQGATWAPDDTVVIGSYTAGLQRVSPGGVAAVLTLTGPGERAHAWPEMLPGGRAVLFTVIATTGGIEAAQVAVLDLTTDKYTVLMRGGSHAHYVSSGHLVYTAGGTLKAVPFDVVGLKTHGTPVTVLPHLVTPPTGGGQFVVAADGTLAYVDAPDATSANARTLVWVDRQAREEPLTAEARPYTQPRISPDGTRVALAMTQGADSDIWMWDLARRTLNQVTFPPSGYFFPVWTPDGRRLIFGQPGARLFWQLADGTGATEELASSAGLPSGVTPDGSGVLLSPGGRDLMMLELDTRRIRTLLQTPANERNGIVSPNGHWLVYESDSSMRFEIYVKQYPDMKGQWKISTAGGTRPLWAPNGQELFYVAPDGAIMAVRVHPRDGAWSHDSPAKVFAGSYLTGAPVSGRNYDVASDGKRFLMIKEAASQASHAAPQIVVVQNWLNELKRLVSTK